MNYEVRLTEDAASMLLEIPDPVIRRQVTARAGRLANAPGDLNDIYHLANQLSLSQPTYAGRFLGVAGIRGGMMSSQIYELTSAMALKAARNRLVQLPRRVNDSQTVIPITRRGRPVMALMSWELFESLVETIEIMSDPELMAHISQSEKDIAEGKTVSLHKVMAELSIEYGAAPTPSDSSG